MKRFSENCKSVSPRKERHSNGSGSSNGSSCKSGSTDNLAVMLPGGGATAACNVEQGVAEINSQLCNTMLTMILSEQAAKDFHNSRHNNMMVRKGFRLHLLL